MGSEKREMKKMRLISRKIARIFEIFRENFAGVKV
jgi:hypothetical protein